MGEPHRVVMYHIFCKCDTWRNLLSSKKRKHFLASCFRFPILRLCQPNSAFMGSPTDTPTGTSVGPNFILQKENSPRDGLKKSTKLLLWSTGLVNKIQFRLRCHRFPHYWSVYYVPYRLGLYRRPIKRLRLRRSSIRSLEQT